MRKEQTWRPAFDDRRQQIIDELGSQMDTRKVESGMDLLEWDKCHSRWQTAVDAYSRDATVSELLARVAMEAP